MKKNLLFGFIILSTLTYSNPIDSLENVLKTAKGDLKVKTLNELFRAYINSDPVKAIGYTREALTLATEIDDRKGMAASEICFRSPFATETLPATSRKFGEFSVPSRSGVSLPINSSVSP